jgi:hypothetical protein
MIVACRLACFLMKRSDVRLRTHRIRARYRRALDPAAVPSPAILAPPVGEARQS